jgi:rhamnose transport system ATP-binding protein
MLRLKGISKSFAGVQALKGVSFDLRAGEVHALVGENGAGKSTLIKVITGAHGPDEGAMEVDGELVEDLDPVKARALGIAAIYQQPALFPDLTVAENIAIGLEPAGWWRRVRWDERRDRARRLLDRIGAAIDPEADVRGLSMPEQQLVEIARALGAEARILIMDEPTASLSDQEVHRLFRVIGELKARGVGIIYISHRLEELPLIADRVTALRDGALVGTLRMAEVSRAELIRMMVGRELSAVFPKVAAEPGDVVLEVRGLGRTASGVHDVDLSVRAGEVVGLAGLVGAGRTELARVLFGLTPTDAGAVRLRGRSVAVDSPARAVALGIAYVPEDRRRHGVILEMSTAANTTLATLRAHARLGLLDERRERATAAEFVRRLGIKTPTLDAPVGNLSGGNQQKVALARWLAAGPTLLILDEPTQGVDVGAKAEIHRLMSELAGEGMAILMISSELPEVLGMSDRIAVMHGGTVVAVMDRAGATQEAILERALGHGAADNHEADAEQKRNHESHESTRIKTGGSAQPREAPTRQIREPARRDPLFSFAGIRAIRGSFPSISRYRREASVASAFVVLLLLLAAVAPRFFRADQLRPLVVANAPVLVAAVGMTLVILCRQIDISIGSIFSICGVIAGLLSRSGLPMAVVGLGTLLGGGALGAVNGSLVAGLGLPSIVVTLATLVIGRESLRYLREGEFVRDLPPGFQWFGAGQSAGQWLVVAIALLFFAASAWGLRHLAAGRAVYATGSDPEAARLAGIRPRRVTFGVFVTMGALAGLAALLSAVRLPDVDPNAGSGLELQVIAAVVVGGVAISGGRGTMAGTLIGVALLGSIGPALFFLGTKPQWEKAIQGLIILLAVASDALYRERNGSA